MKKRVYVKLETIKEGMSQEFDENGEVIVYTNLRAIPDKLLEVKLLERNRKIIVAGVSKGKGFAGTVKRWNFRAGPRTHGQDKHRSPGSIGTQGQGRVIPGKKMAGRMGGKKVAIKTKLIGFNEESGLLKVKGAVPGHRKSLVNVYIEKNEANEKAD